MADRVSVRDGEFNEKTFVSKFRPCRVRPRPIGNDHVHDDASGHGGNIFDGERHPHIPQAVGQTMLRCRSKASGADSLVHYWGWARRQALVERRRKAVNRMASRNLPTPACGRAAGGVP